MQKKDANDIKEKHILIQIVEDTGTIGEEITAESGDSHLQIFADGTKKYVLNHQKYKRKNIKIKVLKSSITNIK